MKGEPSNIRGEAPGLPKSRAGIAPAGGPSPFLDLSAIAPKLGTLEKPNADRMFIVGRSGSGKTFAAKKLLDYYSPEESTPPEFRAYVCVFDPNGNFEYPGRRVHAPSQVVPDRASPVVIYEPSPQYDTADGWNDALGRLFAARETVRGKERPKRILLLIDEFTALDTLFGKRTLEGGNMLTAYMGRGRALGKAAIVLTQAPAAIPLTVIRNAERFVIFDLPLDDDRDRMAGVVGRYTIERDPKTGEEVRVDVRDRTALRRYQFWYFGPEVSQAVRIGVKG